MVELTYGPGADWYRNSVAAGGCVVLFHGQDFVIDRIEGCDAEEGRRAFHRTRSLAFRLLGRQEFRRLLAPVRASDADTG